MPKRTAQPTNNAEPTGTPRQGAPRSDAPPLPPGWAWTTLEEVATLIKPGFPSGQHNQEGRGVPHLRPMNIEWKGVIDLAEVKFVEINHEYERLRKGDVLFNNTNSPPLVGKTALIRHDTNWAFSNHMTLIRLKRAVVEPAWVAWYLHQLFWSGYFRLHCRHHVNQASINTNFLKRVRLPLAPLPEQRRIVARIEELFSQLDAAEEGLRRVQRNLKRYRAAVLKAAVEGRLVPTEAELARREGRPYETGEELLQRILAERRHRWEKQEWAKLVERAKKKAAQARRKARGLPARIKDIPPDEWQAIPEDEYRRYLPKDDRWKQRYKEPTPPDTSTLPPLPEGWVWATVEMVGDPHEQPVLTGPFGATLGKEDFVSSGVPVLTIGCLTEDGVSLSKAMYITPEKAHELERYQVRKGDLLFSRMATVGRAGVVTERLEGALINYHLMRLRLARNVIDPYFFLAYVQGSQVVSDYVRKVNHGATRDGINTKQLLALPVPIPPFAEQHRIVAEVERRLSVAREAEKAVEASLKRIARLRQAILKRAFEGKLVPQDPNDEPAEVLLERVKHNRESQELPLFQVP